MTKADERAGAMTVDFEDSMKAFLVAETDRRAVFDRFYEALPGTINGDRPITPEDALSLLTHHFVFGRVMEIITGTKVRRSPLLALLDRTLEELGLRKKEN